MSGPALRRSLRKGSEQGARADTQCRCVGAEPGARPLHQATHLPRSCGGAARDSGLREHRAKGLCRSAGWSSADPSESSHRRASHRLGWWPAKRSRRPCGRLFSVHAEPSRGPCVVALLRPFGCVIQECNRHAGPPPSSETRAQRYRVTSSANKPTRSRPLPRTDTRPHRLQHPARARVIFASLRSTTNGSAWLRCPSCPARAVI